MSSLLKSIPDEWGPRYEGDAGAVARTRTGPNAIQFTAPTHIALVMFSPQPDRQVALNSDKRLTALAPVGSIEIVPAQSDLYARWVVDKENLLVAVDPARLKNLAELEFGTDRFELEPPKLGYVDRKALAVGYLIRDELLLDGGPNGDCLDSLLTVFGTYLLRNYSSLGQRQWHAPKGGLAPQKLRRINDYIQAHIGSKISVEQMAEIAQMSPSHFLRAFRQSTGLPPHQFLIAARLAHARHLITTTSTPLDEIARSAGFNSHSHMTASMQRVWSIRPSTFRSQR
jgi:AraC family transcriptional regulator